MAGKNSATFKVTNNSNKVFARLIQTSRAAVEAGLLIVEAEAKSKAPVDTGDLRDHISHKIVSKGKLIEGQVGSPSFYAPYVEYGTGEFAENGAGRKGGWMYKDAAGDVHFTRGTKPTKFLRNSFRSTKGKVKSTVLEHFKGV